jgi:hypothetical protein
MTAKRSPRSKRARAGGGVTEKGTRPEEPRGRRGKGRPEPELSVRRATRDEPNKGRRATGPAVGAPAAHRGMR